MDTAKLITNDKLNITEKIKGTRNCKEREIICDVPRSYISDIQGNILQSASPNIAMT